MVVLVNPSYPIPNSAEFNCFSPILSVPQLAEARQLRVVKFFAMESLRLSGFNLITYKKDRKISSTQATL